MRAGKHTQIPGDATRRTALSDDRQCWKGEELWNSILRDVVWGSRSGYVYRYSSVACGGRTNSSVLSSLSSLCPLIRVSPITIPQNVDICPPPQPPSDNGSLDRASSPANATARRARRMRSRTIGVQLPNMGRLTPTNHNARPIPPTRAYNARQRGRGRVRE